MPAIKSFLLSRLPWVGFVIAWVTIYCYRVLTLSFCSGSRRHLDRSCVAIEAGEQGWNAIEFKELYLSATEYAGVNCVKKVVIDKSVSYVLQVKQILGDHNITHYIYDPRTGRQGFWGGMIEAVSIALLMERYGVVPIVYLTDLSVRVWRLQASAVSAARGIVVTFMMPKLVQPIFPHRRLAGPSLMPFSRETLFKLQQMRKSLELDHSIQGIVRFTGSLYEPRTSFLHAFRDKLLQTGHTIEILGRKLGSARVTDEEYWRRLATATIIITTADQAHQSGTDYVSIPHLVYRYLEVLASGSLLLAPEVPGISRYFQANQHFISYVSLEEAVERAKYYLEQPGAAENIRISGHERATQLIESHSFWIQIDTALGAYSISR
jgi:hypothetical protein